MIFDILFINTKDFFCNEETEFDDTKIKNKLESFKSYWYKLDDCVVTSILNNLSEKFDIVAMDELFDQESFTEAEAVLVYEYLQLIIPMIKEELYDKILEIEDVIDQINSLIVL